MYWRLTCLVYQRPKADKNLVADCGIVVRPGAFDVIDTKEYGEEAGGGIPAVGMRIDIAWLEMI